MESITQETNFVKISYPENLPDEAISLDAESRLQSLGFTLINGKPRFNIDKDKQVEEDDSQQSSMAEREDSVSFVVLGKTSLDSIQASSLDSYTDIQQKAMSIDYKSMISSLNTAEIQQKLTELLQENVKLKETLKQNNIAMKQQFNTLAVWRELVMKVHQKHKEKFVVSNKIINYLKLQNAKLKLKLKNVNDDDLTEEYKLINMSDINSGYENTVPSTSTTKLQPTEKQVPHTTDLNTFTGTQEELPFNTKESLNITDSMDLNATKNINTKAASMDTIPNPSNKSRDCGSPRMSSSLKEMIGYNKSCDKCNAKDESIKNLNEFINLLEYKLKHAVALIQFCIRNSTNSGRSLQSIQKFKKEFTEIFASEIEEFLELREYLNEFVIQTLKDVTLTESDILGSESDTCNLYNESFLKKTKSANQSILVNKEKDETKIKSCEKLRNDLCKHKGDADSEYFQSLIEQINVENTSLDAERKILEHEKASLEQEKRIISSQRKGLEAEYRSIGNTKQLLEQERISLNEEKMSLDQQSQLYESHEKILQKEKKFIESKCVKYVDEIKSLQEDLKQKIIDINCLKEQVEYCKEEKQLLETQLRIYKEDFEQERKSKESFLEQKNKLDVDLEKQFKYNQKLQEEIARLKHCTSSAVAFGHDDTTAPNLKPPEMLNLACPKCECYFADIPSLESHVDTCLELD